MTRVAFTTRPEPVNVPGKGEFPSRYAPDCFARMPGQQVPWMYRETDGTRGRGLGTATVVSVTVNAGGTSAEWVLDLDPPDPAETIPLTGDVL